tara:strand:+ start:30 stop:569 length:540 start_codon:yes stop_codon:yes gene_type:complete
MGIEDWLMIIAVLLAPVIAVQVTQRLEYARAKREEKLRVFKTLMATRATNLAAAHVEALNMIDVSFYESNRKNEKVISAWKVYLDHLNDMGYPKEGWESKRKELFVDLLHTMAVALGYDFDKSHIKNTSYYPSGHGDIEEDQYLLRKGLVGLLDGKLSLPMHLTKPVVSSVHEQETHNK